MKKIIAVILTLVLLLAMTGCASKRCALCGARGAGYSVSEMGSLRLCEDCYDDYMDDDDYDSNYNYGNNYDYDYNGSNKTGSRCYDCGKSIPSGRLYCDSCLGYGKCQDCGKSIASDRLYCDKCLGYGKCQDCGKSIASDRLYCDKCLGYGTCQDCGKSIASDRLYCNSCLYK